ncbi:MAG: UPF0056 inner membrane protein [bacterium]|nr:MAG: UPF0056 inner membrane protein [bacterium]
MPGFAEILKQTMGIMAIVDPVGCVGIFLILTSGQTLMERRKTAIIAPLTMAVVLILSMVLGERFLWFFGIGIPSFQIGGGILVLLVSLDMLKARTTRFKETPEEVREAEDKANIAVVPLGMPLLAGPGAITAVIIQSHSATTTQGAAIIIGIIMAISFITWLTFRLALPISSLMGQTGMNIVTRLMGLILMAIAVETIAHGLKALFPILNGLS